MVIYIENNNESIKKSLELIKEFMKLIDDKVNIKKLTVRPAWWYSGEVHALCFGSWGFTGQIDQFLFTHLAMYHKLYPRPKQYYPTTWYF